MEKQERIKEYVEEMTKEELAESLIDMTEKAVRNEKLIRRLQQVVDDGERTRRKIGNGNFQSVVCNNV